MLVISIQFTCASVGEKENIDNITMHGMYVEKNVYNCYEYILNKGNNNLHTNINLNKGHIVNNSRDPHAHCQFAFNCLCSASLVAVCSYSLACFRSLTCGKERESPERLSAQTSSPCRLPKLLLFGRLQAHRHSNV